MKPFFSAVQRFLDRGGAVPDDNRLFRVFLLILLGWLLVWSVWPALCIGNAPVDVVENYAWGQNFSFGYDKNPYFGAWLSYWVYRLCPVEEIFYLLCQLCVFIALVSVYRLAEKIFRDGFSAFMSAVLCLFVPFFSQSGCEFNDDMISVPLYALCALNFYQAVRTGSIRNWLALGFCAGLALMTKYLAAVLFLPLGALLIFTAEGRKSWKNPCLYLALAVFMLLVIPNVVWLYQHDFIAFRYAAGRARLDNGGSGWTEHLLSPLAVLLDFGIRFFGAALPLLLFRRRQVAAADKFSRRFLAAVAAGPLLLTMLFAAVTGGYVYKSWTAPYYVFCGLALVALYRPAPGGFRFRLFLAVLTVFGVIISFWCGYEYLVKRSYLRRHAGYCSYPGRQTAAELTATWRKAYGIAVPYVIGGRKESCNMTFYSPDHPRAFFDADVRQSPWINPGDIEKHGAVLIWSDGRIPPLMRGYVDRADALLTLRCRRAVPEWWCRLIRRTPALETVNAAFIAPDLYGVRH